MLNAQALFFVTIFFKCEHLQRNVFDSFYQKLLSPVQGSNADFVAQTLYSRNVATERGIETMISL